MNALLHTQEVKVVKKSARYRRSADEIVKAFRCPYDNCGRSYGTQVSLNLHIKKKHKGGTFTQRNQIIVGVLSSSIL
jgi:hypothetical protein